MLPRALRYPLRQHPEFFRVAAYTSLPHFRVFRLKLELGQPAQAVIVVPKTVVALSSERNLIKRQLRAFLSSLLPSLSSQALMVVLKKRYGAKLDELAKQELLRALKK